MEATQQKILESFVNLSGADEEFAISFLESNGWDLDTSLNIYLEGNELSRPIISKRGSSKKEPTRAQKRQKLAPSVETTPSPSSLVDEEIRLPIAPVTQILSEDPSGSMRNLRSRSFRSTTKPKAVFDALRDFKTERQFMESNVKSNDKKVRHLADIFRPPVDIVCLQIFESAKVTAIENLKWLLVNIQDTSVFQCQMLNRDTWSNLALKTFLVEHFIFWQRYHDSEDALYYCKYYPIEDYPHIAVIDPRTGESMIRWNHFIEAQDLLKQLTEFVHTHSVREFSSPKEVPLIDRSEDEQIAAAIAASLTSDSQAGENQLLKEEDFYDSLEDQGEEEVLTTTMALPIQPIEITDESPSITEPVPSVVSCSPETNQGGNVASKPDADCTVQIRESNGNILKTMLHSSDTIQSIYDYVEIHRTDGGTPFTLVTPFPKKELEVKSKTIEECDLGKRFVLIVSLNT